MYWDLLYRPQRVPGGIWGNWWEWTVTTDRTTPASPAIDEDSIRKIVREEIADILPIDVPDTPPEDL